MRQNVWAMPEQVDKKFCSDLIAEAQASKFELGRIGGSSSRNRDVRSNSVVWLPRFHLAECALFHHAIAANSYMDWNMNLTGCFEPAQVSRYEQDQHYGPHHDMMAPQEGQTVERKMTAILLLSDGDSYEGGDLKVEDHIVPCRKQGTIIVFPCFMMHQVTPVTKGTRYSAVAWIGGPLFR